MVAVALEAGSGVLGGGVVGVAGAAVTCGTAWDGDFGGKSGVVFAVGGEPVNGGAEGLGG